MTQSPSDGTRNKTALGFLALAVVPRLLIQAGGAQDTWKEFGKDRRRSGHQPELWRAAECSPSSSGEATSKGTRTRVCAGSEPSGTVGHAEPAADRPRLPRALVDLDPQRTGRQPPPPSVFCPSSGGGRPWRRRWRGEEKQGACPLFGCLGHCLRRLPLPRGPALAARTAAAPASSWQTRSFPLKL